MAELVKCPTCGNSISTNADSCPSCGEDDFYITETKPEKNPCNMCNHSGKSRTLNRGSGKFESGSCQYCEGTGIRTSYVTKRFRRT